MNVLQTTTVAVLTSLILAETASATDFTKIEDVKRGTSVSLSGEVTKILDDDEFRLRDASGATDVYIGWRNRVTLNVGDTVIVHGAADDDVLPGFTPDIYAEKLVLSNGDVIELE